MKELFLIYNHPDCQEEEILSGIFAGKLQKMPPKNGRFPESLVKMEYICLVLYEKLL